MRLSFDGLDKRMRGLIGRIGREGDACGLAAYAVGGFVRDILLRRKNLDCDIVVEGDAAILARRLARKTKGRLTVYRQFGTATVRLPDGLEVDLATARREYYPRPGALPVVCPGSIGDDLFRRDFTINAMAVRINRDRFGELVDTLGGRKDLPKKSVRILHDKSFIDDPTRILRAVRFEQRFGFRLERRTAVSLRTAIKNGAVSRVNPARYFAEFRKILEEPDAVKMIRRLHQFGGLRFLGKDFRLGLRRLGRMERNIRKMKHSRFYAAKDWGTEYLLALLQDASRPALRRMIREFHLTRKEKEALLAIPRLAPLHKALGKKGLRPSQVFQLLKGANLEIICFIRAQTSVKIVQDRIDVFLKESRLCRLSIGGDDLRRIGVAPGQEMGLLLSRLLGMKIDGEITSRSEELREARKLKGVVWRGSKEKRGR